MAKRKLTDEQIVDLLKEGEKGELSVAELCSKYNISEPTYYNLKAKYQGTNTAELKRLKQLEQENARLLKLVGQLTLENSAIKEVLKKKW